MFKSLDHYIQALYPMDIVATLQTQYAHEVAEHGNKSKALIKTENQFQKELHKQLNAQVIVDLVVQVHEIATRQTAERIARGYYVHWLKKTLRSFRAKVPEAQTDEKIRKAKQIANLIEQKYPPEETEIPESQVPELTDDEEKTYQAVAYHHTDQLCQLESP